MTNLDLSPPSKSPKNKAFFLFGTALILFANVIIWTGDARADEAACGLRFDNIINQKVIDKWVNIERIRRDFIRRCQSSSSNESPASLNKALADAGLANTDFAELIVRDLEDANHASI